MVEFRAPRPRPRQPPPNPVSIRLLTVVRQTHRHWRLPLPKEQLHWLPSAPHHMLQLRQRCPPACAFFYSAANYCFKGESCRAQAGVSSAATKSNSTPGADSSNTNGASMNDPGQQANAFGGMMMNPFMMYSIMGPQGMNMMGMPMAMPMGMNMNGMTGVNDVNGSSGTNEAGSGNNMNGMNGMNAMAGMNGMQLPMQLQLQLQLQMQMQMAQMAQMNGMGGINGMQMPMGLPGMSMGMNMPMPLNMNMQQQQQVNPQSGLAGDVEMTPQRRRQLSPWRCLPQVAQC